ncbi:putative biotrophy-associated secreted protein 2 protein [Eutypa lata UCREL1]|uniref:Putative biotrophy-associated secreted protein 2 protein n=1 Tax=Eutypa lata (strain UCR-EL1) TaxID=1287681 RepID=M7SWJ9_EUTLA|nr:putative biotrophy-associated secreted protein 2 protein [Eutypa lata UCREL1]
MLQSTISVTILFALTVLAIPSPQLKPDPAGEKNVGNGAGAQFIGGACLSSADCASTCCATLNGAGICSGLGAQFQAGKEGCGFGDDGAAAPPADDTAATPDTGADTGADAGAGADEAGSQNVGKGDGSQFITGQCLSDADCASGCCANPDGVCSAVAVANEAGKEGCGFVGTA